MANDAADQDQVVSLEEKRNAREELDAFLADVQAATEPEWEAVTVPAWNGRTVFVRGLSVAERVRLRSEGYRPDKREDGEVYYRETGNLEPLLVQLTVYVEVAGRKQRLFQPDAKTMDLIRRQRGGALDDLVAVALRLSGLAKSSSEEAKQDFLSDPTNSPDSEWPEISE